MEETNKQDKTLKKETIIKKTIKIFWVFIIGSIIGYIIEMIVGLVQNGHFVSRQGLLYGPFIQVYGVGLVVYYLILSNIKLKNNIRVFLLSMIMGGVVEYLFSYFQELFFGTVSWDYSNLLFNINGRTSLLHCVYWGTGGVLFVKFILPIVDKLNTFIENTKFKYITTVLIIFISFDIVISSLAGARQLERRENIPAQNNIDIFFDKNYPDDKLKQIYSNAKIIDD